MHLLKLPKKRSLLAIKLLVLWLSLSSSHSYSNVTTYDELATIDRICVSSPTKCLGLIDDVLVSSTPNSRQWYRLKLHQLDAFFTLQQFEKLSLEVNFLLTDQTLPINVSVYVYLYHAKLCFKNKDIIQAHEYINKTVNLMTQLNDKYPNPMRLIEIANLQTSMKDYEPAQKTLLQLEKKFESRYHPIFKRELYANLGHVAYYQGDNDLHLQYRKKSLLWALKVDNNQQIGIAYNNFAWAYQKIGDYKNAEKNYTQAIEIARIEQDDINGTITQLRLVEVTFLQGKIERALQLFKQLPTRAAGNNDSERHNELYWELKSKLKQ
jgi:tetratricopeptide (TPR) repeat protein